MNARNYRREIMMRLGILTLFCVALISAVARPPKPTPVPPLFLIDEPIAPPDAMPQVDALTFINRSTFFFSNDFLFLPIQRTPFQAQSVVNWENSGIMVGIPGFRFDNTPNPAHMTTKERRKKGALLSKPSQNFLNSGEITVSDYLRVDANNLVNPGVLSGDVNSRIRLYANNGFADLSRGVVRTGDLPQPDCISASNFFFGPFFFFGDPAVSYNYFDSGVSGFVNTNRIPLSLPTLTSTNFFFGANFSLTNPAPPSFQYRQFLATFPGGPATNRVTNSQFSIPSCGIYDAFVHVRTNSVGTNSFGRDIRVVFVPTNNLSANVSVGVSFPTNNSGFFFSDNPIVEFRALEFDIVEQAERTNYLTFRDSGANIFRSRDCEFDSGESANARLATDLFYNTNFASPTADYTYTVASARIGNTNSFFFSNAPANPFIFFPALGSSLAASDPTNRPGYVDIRARTLDLSQARIRSENGINIQATNLIGIESAFLDAPFINFDAATTNQNLVISNMIAQQVTRLQADLNSWSGDWSVQVDSGRFTTIITTNFPNGTNVPIFETWNYHVLILGACINGASPSITHRFSLHATNIVIEDNLAINAALLLEGRSLTLGSNASLTMPRSANLAFTNIQGIVNFTNHGVVNVPNGVYFGVFEDGYVQLPLKKKKKLKGPQPPRLITYENFVNHGSIISGSFKARSGYIEETGTALTRSTTIASNGPAILNGGDILISNALIQARSDLQLTAGNLLVTHATLLAGSTNAGSFNNFIPGAIVIDATNSLTDTGLASSNEWRATAGIRMLRRPQVMGDLMGTRISLFASTFAQSTITWAAEDRGPIVEGFEDNLAVGRLVLNGALLSRFNFRSASGSNALYVDYLELPDSATNYSGKIAVDNNFTIYFADSNIAPDKLADIFNGRIQWVSSFAGPQSSTNLTYPDGSSHTFNAGLVRARDLDSDGDGFPNYQDCTPIAVPGFDTTGQQCSGLASRRSSPVSASSTAALNLTITYGEDGRDVVLSWDAAVGSSSAVEFSESLTGGTWQSLTNFINGSVNARVTVRDAAKSPQRVYRVRVDAAKP